MRKEIKRNLKIYACGLLSGAVLMVGASRYGKISKMEEKSPFVDEFPLPKLEQSFDAKDTKTVEQYTFDYYGGKITIQDDELLIYGFDENGNMYVEHGEKVEVPVENHQYILDQYISEQESKVYTLIEKKDKIKNQYAILRLFEEMVKLYEEYLIRKPFDGLKERKEVIYNVGYSYIVSDKDYTIGGYKFSELNKTIQKDILTEFKKIAYMHKNGKVQEESKFEEFWEQNKKTIRYQILKIGKEGRVK